MGFLSFIEFTTFRMDVATADNEQTTMHVNLTQIVFNMSFHSIVEQIKQEISLKKTRFEAGSKLQLHGMVRLSEQLPVHTLGDCNRLLKLMYFRSNLF